MKPPLNFILATAGHVDHGKSSLVKALTGTDPDRLPEEKARGITIDLGFAHLELAGVRDGEAVAYNVGIVDVPGHEDFVKNMVAGVGSIDLALLVVAADDGWMPQTEEHLQILTYLGVTRAIVALTKIDLVQDERERASMIREKLVDSPFADAPIVAISTVTNHGIAELKSALIAALAEAAMPRDIGKPRLAVDRVFDLRGIGAVVTGTLSGGTFRRGQNVAIQPAGAVGKIRSIQSHNHTVESVGPGTRTALNIPDAPVERGDIVTLAEFAPSDTWDVLIQKSPRSDTPAVRNNQLVRVHFGSGNRRARMVLLDGNAVSPGECGFAQLRFAEEVAALTGDHFIVRDWSERFTLAGGTILDVEAQRRGFHRPERRQFLESRAAAPHNAAAFVQSLLERDRFVQKANVLVRSRFSAAEISTALAKHVVGDFAVDSQFWERAREAAAQKIEAAHKSNPDAAGIQLTELRATLDLPPEIFDEVVRDLGTRGYTRQTNTIGRLSHRRELPPHLQLAATAVRARLSAKPFDPPSRKEIAPDDAAQHALRFLLQTGEATEVSPDVVMLTLHLQRALGSVKNHLDAKGQATAGELRQAIGTSRRVIIPLLEYADKQGVTRRVGDARVLNRATG